MLTVEATLIDDAGLNRDELKKIVQLAGKGTGIGDGRKLALDDSNEQLSALYSKRGDAEQLANAFLAKRK